MKTIFYTSTLWDDNLGLRDKFLYSQILYISLWDNGRETFGADGKNVSLNDCIDHPDYKHKLIPLSSRLSRCDYTELIQISRSQMYKSMGVLWDRGYIIRYGSSDYVIADDDVIKNFFELRVETGLRGTPLLVYSYIANKNKKYKWLDKYHVCIAQDLNLSPLVLSNCLRDLTKREFIAEERHGKRKHLQAIEKTPPSPTT